MISNIEYNNKIIKFRILIYKINNNNYYLGTTIMNKTVAYFKNIYWKRWNNEVKFKQSQYLLTLNNILSKNINKIQQDIYSINILFIIHSFFKNNIQQSIQAGKFINSKNLMYLITNNTLYLVLYKKITSAVKKNLIKYLKVY
jgi:hypothetical protein